jgi:C4-dicarboxylate-specific signal transduction histidine kinase
VSNKNYKSILVAAFLIAIWNGSAWLITKSNYTSNIQELVERETKLSKVQAADLADSITRNLNYIHGISDLLSQVTHVKEAVSRFGATVARSPLSFAKKQKLWTADTKLKEVNRYLYYAHLALQADLIYVANAAGDIIAASNYEDQGNAVGANIAAREYFAANKNRQRGMQFAVGMTTNIPGIYFSTPIFIDRKFMGAVVVKVNVPDLTFLVSQVNSFVTDVNGVIILSRDQDLAMHALPGASISRISVNDRLYRYKRSDFPVA